MDAGHREAGGRERREGHVNGFRRPGRVQHGGDRVDGGRLPVHEEEPRRAVHPGVGGYHEDAR